MTPRDILIAVWPWSLPDETASQGADMVLKALDAAGYVLVPKMEVVQLQFDPHTEIDELKAEIEELKAQRERLLAVLNQGMTLIDHLMGELAQQGGRKPPFAVALAKQQFHDAMKALLS